GICPERDKGKGEIEKQERILLGIDEFERGHPRMTLSLLLDVVTKCLAVVNKVCFEPFNAVLRSEAGRASLEKFIKPKELPADARSWGKVKSLLWRMNKLKVFDRHVKNGPRF